MVCVSAFFCVWVCVLVVWYVVCGEVCALTFGWVVLCLCCDVLCE